MATDEDPAAQYRKLDNAYKAKRREYDEATTALAEAAAAEDAAFEELATARRAAARAGADTKGEAQAAALRAAQAMAAAAEMHTRALNDREALWAELKSMKGVADELREEIRAPYAKPGSS